MYTNLNAHGGNFRDVLNKEFSTADNVVVASGYASLDMIVAFEKNFISIAKNGGQSKLLLGMAFYEGLSEKKLSFATKLNEKLRSYSNNSGVYVANGRRYHGKVYRFGDDKNNNIYLGSSNFSASGTKGNIECTLQVIDQHQKELINNFLNELYSDNYSIGIHEADILIPNKKKVIKNKVTRLWSELNKHQYDLKQLENAPKFELDLARIADKEKSNLNVYFGKGRWNRSTNRIKPRPWYEVELIADQKLRDNPNYPRGDFNLFTDDNLVIPMRTQGDFFKNIRSKNSLQLFGIWIKGKLEKAGVLKKYEPITKETLEEYGSNSIIFYKINDNDYYIKF
ncbi:MAG: NgoFVII family restriction endonuclease [Legionellales bacterium]|nr:NgoFVII family restriction endonuclease [Legionellales bacterium]